MARYLFLYFKLVADRGMGETFYTVLGVDDGADREAIQRAYRALVKETHPDVSDSPNAAERFRRLTTARDVLVDDRERRRYDRLGHEAYVSRHVQNSTWTADPTDERAGTTDEPGAAGQAGQTGPDHDASSRQARARTAGRSRGQTRSHTGGGYGNADWQTASEAYRRTQMNVEAGRPSLRDRLLGAARALGPWLFAHLTLIASAVVWVWFFYATTLSTTVSVPALVGITFVVLLSVALSTLHMLLELHS
jgi:hypothetical protein